MHVFMRFESFARCSRSALSGDSRRPCTYVTRTLYDEYVVQGNVVPDAYKGSGSLIVFLYLEKHGKQRSNASYRMGQGMRGALKTEASIDQLAVPTCQAPDACTKMRHFDASREFLLVQSAPILNFRFGPKPIERKVKQRVL